MEVASNSWVGGSECLLKLMKPMSQFSTPLKIKTYNKYVQFPEVLRVRALEH